MPSPVWSAPVRFAEVDDQGVVFNAHYLTWCDEAMNAFFTQRSTPAVDLSDFSTRVRLVSSSLTWRRSAVWKDVVDVDVHCARVGRTSLTLEFAVQVAGELCCRVTTVYVHVGDDGRPEPVPDAVRARLGPDGNGGGGSGGSGTG